MSEALPKTLDSKMSDEGSTRKAIKAVIITGVSGGGKTTALRAVEDLGFYCIDNLPLNLFEPLFEHLEFESKVDRVAIVIDSRLSDNIRGFPTVSERLNKRGIQTEVIYLDANTNVLIRRFSETRRRHPLSETSLEDGLAEERRLLTPIRACANVCIDTSQMSSHELKHLIQDQYQKRGKNLVVSIISFGFRYGIPRNSDLLFDVRFMPNPYFDESLRALCGLDKAVSDFVLNPPDTQTFLQKSEDWLQFLLPRYAAEGKVYLTIGVGCTGGRHRSVAIAEELERRLKKCGTVNVRHRDLEKSSREMLRGI